MSGFFYNPQINPNTPYSTGQYIAGGGTTTIIGGGGGAIDTSEITALLASTYLPLAGGSLSGQLNTIAPVANSNAANKQYVDAKAADSLIEVGNKLSKFGDTCTGYLKMTLQPAAATDLCNKSYVDGAITNNTVSQPLSDVLTQLSTIPETAGNLLAFNASGITSLTPTQVNTVLNVYSKPDVNALIASTQPLNANLNDIAAIVPVANCTLGTDANDIVLLTPTQQRTAISVYSNTEVNSILANYVPLAGSTMTGQLNTIAPIADTNAANKLYVDTAIAGVSGGTPSGAVLIAGSTMTGQLNTIAPVSGSNATNKTYVDAAIAGVSAGAPAGAVLIAGSTMTGQLNTIAPVSGSNATNKTYVDTTAAKYVPLIGNASITGSLTMNAYKITGLGTPTLATDAATKGYVDTTAAKYVPLTGNASITGPLAMNAYTITGLGTPTLATDATNKNYVDTTAAKYVPLTGNASITGALAMNAYKITGLGTPTLATDAATKGYVDTTAATATTSANAYALANCVNKPAAYTLTLPVATPTANTSLTFNGSSYTWAAASASSLLAGANITIAGSTISLNTALTAIASLGMTGVISMNNNKITLLAAPTVATDAATMGYVDVIGANANTYALANCVNKPAAYTVVLPISAPTADTYLKYNGSAYIWATAGGGGSSLTAGANLTITGSVVALNTALTAITSLGMTGPINMNSNQINLLAEPTLSSDAATKSYADAKATASNAFATAADVANLNVAKAYTDEKTTIAIPPDAFVAKFLFDGLLFSNVIYSSQPGVIYIVAPSPVQIDGLTVEVGDYVLVNVYNHLELGGPWYVSSYNNDATELLRGFPVALNQFKLGSKYYITSGLSYGDSHWFQTSADSTALYTTPITFAQYTHGTFNTAGKNMILLGNEMTLKSNIVDISSLAMTGPISMNFNQIKMLDEPFEFNDAATKGYVDTAASAVTTACNAFATAADAVLSTNLLAVAKSYTDNSIAVNDAPAGASVVKFYFDGNTPLYADTRYEFNATMIIIDAPTPISLDGIEVRVGDHVLVNVPGHLEFGGPWYVHDFGYGSTLLNRISPVTFSQFEQGNTYYVAAGTTYGKTNWRQTSADAIWENFITEPVTFEQYYPSSSSGSSITAGKNLILTGDVMALKPNIVDITSFGLKNADNSTGVVTLSKSSGSTSYALALPSNAPTANTALTYDGTDYVWGSSSSSSPVTASAHIHVANTDSGNISTTENQGFPFTYTYSSVSSVITANSTMTEFTLLPGYSYKCTAAMGQNNSTNYFIYQWADVTDGYDDITGKLFGVQGTINNSKPLGALAVGYISNNTGSNMKVALIVLNNIIAQINSSGGIFPWATIEVVSNNNAIAAFTGATSTTSGTIGYIPAPPAGTQNSYLRGDGTWASVGPFETNDVPQRIVSCCYYEGISTKNFTIANLIDGAQPTSMIVDLNESPFLDTVVDQYTMNFNDTMLYIGNEYYNGVWRFEALFEGRSIFFRIDFEITPALLYGVGAHFFVTNGVKMGGKTLVQNMTTPANFGLPGSTPITFIPLQSNLDTSPITSLKVGTSSSNYTLTLPSNAPTANTALTYNGSNYVWSAASAVSTSSNYTFVTHNANQAVTVGTVVAFNTVLSSTGAIVAATLNSIYYVLPANGRYKCTACLNSTQLTTFQLYNNLTGVMAPFGSAGQCNLATGLQMAIGYVTTGATTVSIQVQILANPGTILGYNVAGGQGPWLLIEQVSNNNAISAFSGATSSIAGTVGYIPAPPAGTQNSYLRGDGTWQQANNAPTAAICMQVLYVDVVNRSIDTVNGTAFPFNTVKFAIGTSGVITPSPSTTSIRTFTLAAGYTYKCVAQVGQNNSSTDLVYQWSTMPYVAGTTTVFGVLGTLVTPAARNHTAIGYITTTATTTIALIVLVGGGNTVTGDAYGFPNLPWATIEVVSNNNTITQFTGATSSAAGSIGYMPAPAVGQQNHYLRGDGIWAKPTLSYYSASGGNQNIAFNATNFNIPFSTSSSNLGVAGVQKSGTNIDQVSQTTFSLAPGYTYKCTFSCHIHNPTSVNLGEFKFVFSYTTTLPIGSSTYPGQQFGSSFSAQAVVGQQVALNGYVTPVVTTYIGILYNKTVAGNDAGFYQNVLLTIDQLVSQ